MFQVLANHGLINRNGRDIKVDDLVQAMYSCFALDPKIGRKEALKAAKKTGVVNSVFWGPRSFVF